MDKQGETFVPLRANTDLAVGSLFKKAELGREADVAYIRRHVRDCREAGAECSWANYKNIITEAMPKEAKHLSPFNWLKDSTKTTGQDRDDICWDPCSAKRNLLQYSEEHCPKPKLWSLCT